MTHGLGLKHHLIPRGWRRGSIGLTVAAGCLIGSPLIARAEPPSGSVTAACPHGSAEELLTRLETADRGLTSMQAEILLHRSFALEGDEQTRYGMLYFSQESADDEASPRRRFSIRFDGRLVGQRYEEKEQRFIFDGEWLVEINPDQKRFSKRQLAAPGEPFDPLRVGEGPLPIPIGQKKDDILARFDAVLVDATDGIESPDPRQSDQWRKFVEGSCQLKLTPLGESGEDDFTEIRLWYKADSRHTGDDPARLLPRMARTINHAGDVTTVQLVGVEVNFPIGDEYFSTVSPAERGERGWDITVTPLVRSVKQSQDRERGVVHAPLIPPASREPVENDPDDENPASHVPVKPDPEKSDQPPKNS